MKKAILLLCVIIFSCNTKNDKKVNAYDFTTAFEKSNGLETATYKQTIQFYKNLAEVYPEIKIDSIGKTEDELNN